ncbi:MAG: asparagine synthase (glutamine-hydrolyzing) [Alphaproteobacteria bacterium]|nr:asparagine synthase (glutamine-hydrolyzing) [Alphaproteobacteria bacterium]
MCGIAGILIARDRVDAASLPSLAQRMGDALYTRGPDSGGIWCSHEQGIALAHRRLAIIDLSPEGHQPMHAVSGRYVISFNGEIYNYQELRARLNYSWRGHSDTEVLLAAIETWGIERTLRECDGMFAIAIWDMQEQCLTLARDRMGEKPLYYGWANGNIVFASELKAFTTLPNWSPSINRNALHMLMGYSYIAAPHAIYEGIHKLAAAHYVQLKRGDTHATPLPYWSLPAVVEYGTQHRSSLSDSDATEALDAQLRLCVKERMMSDVPLGAFLSGGIDSSTIAALMQVQSTRPIKTFTIGFAEQGFDEAPFAKAVAAHLGTEHHEIYLSPQQALEVIPQLATIYDEPFADSSQIPTHLVSHFARQHVTVALSGDGGDELLGGYNRYVRGPTIWNTVNLLPHQLRIPLAALMLQLHTGLISKLLPNHNSTAARLARKLGNYYEKIGTRTPEDFYLKLCSINEHTESLVIGGHAPDLLPKLQGLNLDYAEWMMLQDALTYFPGDIMAKVDRASMAVSLETRTPFTDPDLIALAWRMPLHQKIRGNKGKWLLRQVLYRYVPEALIERPKSGFSIPLAQWLRGPLKGWAADLLAPDLLKRQGYLNPQTVQQLWNAHQSGGRDMEHRLWNILMFQSWLAAQQTS